MRKIFNKIICFTAASVAALGIFSASACSNVYKAKPLDYVPSENAAVSNGGFAVEKDNYIYFINGSEANTADNTFGTPVRGAIMRISKDNLSKRNYSSVDTVVPHIAYSGNNNAGIFVYGDYVYYATPSTEKNSDGEVQNTDLVFKRTKLDGTDTMKNYYALYSNNSIEYRYVEVDKVVYLVYVATSEDLYGTSCTNIHSVNTSTGKDTLLAYNVNSVMFDKTDVTNPNIFYTMKVPTLKTGTGSSFNTSYSSDYNQIWTVNAAASTPNEYDFSAIDDYDAEEDPLYVNCGKLVFDGIGKVEGMTQSVTQFNSQEKDNDKVDRSAYTYTLSNYQDKTLFYTRTSTLNDSALLFSVTESEFNASGWLPIKNNPEYDSYILRDGASAGNYTYLFEDGKLDSVIISDSNGLIKAAVDGEGKITTDIDNKNNNKFYMTDDGQPTVLLLDNGYIYYSLSGGNGYTINRVSYDGKYTDYNGLPVEDNVNPYTPVKVLDLDSASDWYKPEIFHGQILFPAKTVNMTEYTYVMACDLRVSADSDEMLGNKDIDELNKQFEGISDKIGEVDQSIYENLQNALWYAYYTCDDKYINTLIQAYVDIMNYDEEQIWSKKSIEKYNAFIAADAEGEWKDYSATKDVNGVKVAANKRDYYYALLGKMNEADTEAYGELLKTNYLKEYPEKEQTWFEGLSTGAKVGFIIGVCAGGLIVIGGAVAVALIIVKKRKKKLPVYKKRRIKVDTTDDKNIDVYSDDRD